jgi:hypothetical protein
MAKLSKGDWLVPFKGRNHSGAYAQNFLWRHDTVYVMDNHRAALWCWLQHVDPNSSHSIFHIDRHTDTLQSRLTEWLAHLPSSWDITIDEYLAHSYEWELIGKHVTPVIRWDNYLSIYFALFGSSIDRCHFATHDDGDKPNHRDTFTAEVWELPSNLEYWLDARNKPWIMNVDLDYFFCDDAESPRLMVSDAYLQRCFEAVRKKIDDGTIAVTTLCLTPDEAFTGGWAPANDWLNAYCGFLE